MNSFSDIAGSAIFGTLEGSFGIPESLIFFVLLSQHFRVLRLLGKAVQNRRKTRRAASSGPALDATGHASTRVFGAGDGRRDGTKRISRVISADGKYLRSV